jgi:two-component system phosphate regulon response regulator OmpR
MPILKDSMHCILIIDDDERILDLLGKFLKHSGFRTIGAKNSKEAREILIIEKDNIGAMIVDCMLPDESGIEFMRSLREAGNNIPAIMLTALDEIENKELSFASGIDDYMTKPFDERELIARLGRMIERSLSSHKDTNFVFFGECKFDLERGEVYKNNGEIVNLSSTELNLLRDLCETPHQPVSRKVLAKSICSTVSDRTVDVQITRLRRKIGDNSKEPTIIRTVRHIGYMIMNSEE